MRLGFELLASATTGKPDVRPALEGLWIGEAVFASELAVGASKDDVRLRTLSCPFTSGGDLRPVEPSVLLLATLLRVPIEDAGDVADVQLVRVPMDDTVAVRVALLTRERAVPARLSGLNATLVVDATVPDGAVKGGIGERERALADFIDVMVPVFASAVDPDADGLSSLLDVEDIEGGRGCDPDAFRAFAAVSDAFAAVSLLLFAGGTGGACLGTGMLDGGALTAAALGLLPPPIFHTLRTMDLADERNPNRDLDFATNDGVSITPPSFEQPQISPGGAPMLGRPRLLRRLAFAASNSRFTASRSFAFFCSSAGGSGGASDTRAPARCTSQPCVILTRLLARRSPGSSSSLPSPPLAPTPTPAPSPASSPSSSSSSSPPNPPGTAIRLRDPALMTRAFAALLRRLWPALGRPLPSAPTPTADPRASDLRLTARRAA